MLGRTTDASAGRRSLGLTQRTALLSWLVTTATLALFAVVIIPQQRRIFLENLESKARGVAVSLKDVTAGAVINDDYSTVVEHCGELISGDREIDFLVVTKADGFSLVHDRTGWRSENRKDSLWARPASNGIEVVPGLGRAFHYSQPLEYSGIGWGWIDVGLSLERFDRSVSAIYWRTAALAVLCVVVSLLASIVYARRLARPILNLRQVVQVVSSGDLSARALVNSDDEVGSLARSVNTMAAALLHRDQVSHSVRFAAERFLSTSRWDEVIGEVLKRVGEAVGACRVAVLENGVDASGASQSALRFLWCVPGKEVSNAGLIGATFRHQDSERWVKRFGRGEVIWTDTEVWTDLERSVMEPLGLRSLLLVPVFVEGSWWGVLAIGDDQEARKWPDAEKASLRAVADMLGAAVARQRTQDALLAAKETAEAASVAKSQFLANVSHEIRTPINGVMGMVRLLLRTALTDKQRHYLTNTMTSADTLLTVIGDVLDFSKIEAGKLELEEREFSPADTVDAAVGLLAERAQAKGLELASRVSEDLPRRLRGDPNRVKQILLNLLSNAVKFTNQGSVVLSTALVKSEAGGTTLRFEVRDTGIGIAPEDQAAIFEAFSQADNTMSRAYGGTGLGLSISRELVRLMAGEIGVESTPGLGSRFWFTARFANVPALAHQPERHGADLRGQRVLVVGDSPVVREILGEYVRSWQGLADEAAGGVLALEKLRRASQRGEPFGVVVLDEGKDAPTLARQIRADPALGKTGMVALVPLAHLNMGGSTDHDGFAAVLAKPVRRSEFHDALATAVRPGMPRPPAGIPSEDKAGQAELVGAGTILVAEDNSINQEVIAEVLAAIGYRCVLVRTGREAIERVKVEPPDVVLMDCQMPELDGYEATRAIRDWERTTSLGLSGGHIPIVALTAHAMKGDRERCLAAGMDDYLTKPLDPTELARVLGSWTAAPRAARSIPSRGPSPADSCPAAEHEGIDFPALLHRCMGKEDLARRLIVKFRDQVRRDLDELGSAIREANIARLREIAHRIKGAAANIAAESIRTCASDLEEAGRTLDLALVPALHDRLRASVAVLESAKEAVQT